LLIVTYGFAYHGMGGLVGVVGVDGPWDIKRVLGTVPVYADGSAKFRIPANTPVSLQPLDAEGKAIQLMRSWMTALPGEVVQCAGCHEKQNVAPPARDSLARGREPDAIRPWYGPTRGFSYAREVQPVIDKYCVACHNGQPRSDGPAIADLRGTKKISDWQKWAAPASAGRFSVGYAELHRFVRRPGIESDYHLLEPMEFHADTTELVQILSRGHHNVKLDAEAWDRLVTWIDLNCPYHGTWGEEIAQPGVQRQRRRELLKLYANVDDDPEAVPQTNRRATAPVMPDPLMQIGPESVECPGWPFDAAKAKSRQAAAGPATRKKIELGPGVSLEMVLIPAGEFVMGSTAGAVDERPLRRVRIEKPFWMAAKEVTNQMFNLFDPSHDSGVEDRNGYQFGLRGFPSDRPEQPVVRVCWNEAVAFCRWLSQRSGMKFGLPSEAEWEYACRAGTATAMFYGGLDADSSKFANMADAKLTEFASYPYDTRHTPLENPSKYDAWIPKDARFNDGALLAVEPGRYQPNAWGLYDMHGNVAEWTRSTYRLYPYQPDDEREAATGEGRKVVRGGSWRDRPCRATSSFRLGYEPFQKVYNVGFRIVCE
jgi:formylglycine-generating enzyme required for sulfatase activity